MTNVCFIPSPPVHSGYRSRYTNVFVMSEVLAITRKAHNTQNMSHVGHSPKLTFNTGELQSSRTYKERSVIPYMYMHTQYLLFFQTSNCHLCACSTIYKYFVIYESLSHTILFI
jgi:hypothetical protein